MWWKIQAWLTKVYLGDPASKLKIIGVTGTSGKTTTATLLYKIILGLGYKAGLIGTVEILANDQVLDVEHKIPTTPDAVTLTKIFRKMVDAGCEYVVMEVSSHAMVQKRVAGIKFTGGIFTNLSQDHLDYHKDMEDYFLAKKSFFQMLPPRAFALANVDDARGERMLQGIKANPFSYGFNGTEKDTLFLGEIKKVDFSGLDLVFNGIPLQSKLRGDFNAYNLLAVWSASSLLGFDMKKVNNILENIEPPRGRFETFQSPNGVLVVVDYAHKPDALENIFGAVKKVAYVGHRRDSPMSDIGTHKKKIISVFGCGGDRDSSKRPIMGKIGAMNSDIAIFTSDNPRSEDPVKIIEDMKTTLSPELLAKVKTIPDRREAILESVRLAQSGDVIICAGKGHEDYQIVKGVKTHFDDMEEYKKAYAK